MKRTKHMKKYLSIILLAVFLLFFTDVSLAEELQSNSALPDVVAEFDEDILLSTVKAGFTSEKGQTIVANVTVVDPTFKLSFTPSVPLQNGVYTFTVYATDVVYNPVNESVLVLINESYMWMKLVSPLLGATTSQKVDVIVETEKKSQCGFALVAGASFQQLIFSFDSLKNKQFATKHTFSQFDMNPQDASSIKRILHLQCVDEQERIHYGTADIFYDTTAPVVSFTLIPNPITQKDVTGKISTTLHVTADDLVLCKYVQNTSGNYSAMSFFSGFDGTSAAQYSKTPTYTITPPVPAENQTHKFSFLYTIQCANLPGLLSPQTTLPVEVDLLAPITISLKSPPLYTSNETIEFIAETNKKTQCTYVAGASYDEQQQKQFEKTNGFEHSVMLGSLEDGKHAYTVRCVDEIHIQTKTLSFTVDKSPPETVVVDAPALTCKAQLEATFIGKDKESPIIEYNYSVSSGSDIIVDWTTTSSSSVTLTPSKNKKLNLTKGLIYQFSAMGKNAVGLWSNVGESNGTTYGVGAVACDHKPPVLTLTKNTTKMGIMTEFICYDVDTECDPDTYDYYTTNEKKCSANASYKPFVKSGTGNGSYTLLIPQTTRICYKASDIAGNNASGSTLITLTLNATQNTSQLPCQNAVKDKNESDVDCGGSCLPCATGKQCASAKDCVSNYCLVGVCTAGSCTDEVKNGFEADVDCGSSCEKCSVGMSCSKNGDCASGYCDETSHCGETSCTNDNKDGTETDKDCGGSCDKCAVGKGCEQNSDCISDVCSEFGFCTAEASSLSDASSSSEDDTADDASNESGGSSDFFAPSYLLLYVGVCCVFLGLLINLLYDKKHPKKAQAATPIFTPLISKESLKSQTPRQMTLQEQMQRMLAQAKLRKEQKEKEKERKGIFDIFNGGKTQTTAQEKTESKPLSKTNLSKKESSEKKKDDLFDNLPGSKKEDSFSKLDKLKAKNDDTFSRLDQLKKKEK